jgi:hypothetical protein
MTYKNLERLHDSIRLDVKAYCDKLAEVLGANLRAISVYGSATGTDFIPGKSDVNLVVVVEQIGEPVLTSLLDTVKWGKKKRIAPPLLLTPGYIASSLDVFPIEFVEIRESQALLMGEDFFGALEAKPVEMRLECESQLKAAALRTRQAYLEIGTTKRGAETVLHASLTSLIPVMRAMLRLKGEAVPRGKPDVLRAVGRVFGADSGLLESILKDKAGDEMIGGRQAHEVLASYVEDIEKLAAVIDGL